MSCRTMYCTAMIPTGDGLKGRLVDIASIKQAEVIVRQYEMINSA